MNEENRRLIQEKIAKMLRDGILEATEVEDGEPLLTVTEKGLEKKVEAEISEQTLDRKETIKFLINKFLKSDTSYGEITDIEEDVQSFYDLTRNYIQQEKLDIQALKIKDKILLSRTSSEFEDVKKTVEMYSVLIATRDMIEVWDDCQNKILHLLVLPLRKHFPIGYKSEENRLEIIEELLKENTL